MPEGPEVETIRRGLAKVALGRLITDCASDSSRVFHGDVARHALASVLAGARIGALGRHGKFLLVDLVRDGAATGEVLILHMGMSGQLRSSALSGGSAAQEKHAHLVLSFDDGSDIAFIDPRMFGRVEIDVRPADGVLPPSLSRLGPDAIEAPDPLARLRDRATRSSVAIKTLLLDQNLVAGIGNMYADEMLHRARLLPRRPARTLGSGEMARLAAACGEVLNEAVELGGSSLADRTYRDISGELGSFQTKHRVYGREGEPCLECGEAVAREVFAGRSSHFCARCQS
ncbi:MAG: bifunctional DNA-formamidopyrimidine glycosylase/DNA-(apurinic or apyrimidinic site) lyase [Actinomycetota bacterium]|nr:bifunctional DNA-formamidopyrimidine glycosylase/DNA-(apurinic or apyrimidinic site) lyase [Actinomycetota bacterium]